MYLLLYLLLGRGNGIGNIHLHTQYTLMLEPGGLVCYCLLIRIYLAKGNNSSVINPPLFHLILVLATKKGTVLAISCVDYKTKVMYFKKWHK